MGGKNVCVVLDDCAIRQPFTMSHRRLPVGGPRCTGTERVLVHRKMPMRFIDALTKVARGLRFGNPEDASNFAGPLATHGALAKVAADARAGEEGRREPLVPARSSPAATTGRRAAPREQPIAGTPTSEIFGPICRSR